MNASVVLALAVVVIAGNLEANKLIAEPNNAAVRRGDNHTMICIFEKPAVCTWYKDGTPMRDVHYVNKNNANICTMIILDVRQSAKYKCGTSVQSNSTYSPTSDEVSITVFTENKESPTDKPDSSDIPYNIIWASVASVVVILSVVNTIIIACYRRRKARRTPTPSLSVIQAIQESTPPHQTVALTNSVAGLASRNSTLFHNNRVHTIINNGYLVPIPLRNEDLTVGDNGKSEVPPDRRYENVNESLYEEI